MIQNSCRFTWILTGLLCCFPHLMAQPDVPEAQKNPFTGSTDAKDAGRQIYDGACQGCHGGEAHGSDRAPALGDGILTHGNADGEIFQNIRAGIRGTPMPSFGQLTTDQIWQVVSYIRSLTGPGSLAETVSGDAARGRHVFEVEARCIDCHQISDLGTPIGPDLSAAGTLPAEQLRAAILNPNPLGAGGGTLAAPGPGRGNGRGGRGGRGLGVRPAAVTVRTLDGEEYRGIRRNVCRGASPNGPSSWMLDRK